MLFGKTTRDIGRYGEKVAARYLKKHGYRIRAKNFLSKHGEIDIVAENKEFLAIVEVKARKDSPENFALYGLPSEAVTKKKQQHILYTARLYLEKHPTKKAIRFDVIEVYLGETATVRHIEAAF